MGIHRGSGPLGSGPTGPGSGFSVMPILNNGSHNFILSHLILSNIVDLASKSHDIEIFIILLVYNSSLSFIPIFMTKARSPNQCFLQYASKPGSIRKS